ncbi:MAG: hypothetical protein HC871_03945 [Rhizobiales bacterium]|nr:hypothetical protein [Hyphomicrobiales bacterium]
MISNGRQGLDRASTTRDGRVMVDIRPDPLAFPSTLAGTWPAPDGNDPGQLQHVHALDAVKTFLTSTCHHGSRSMRSWESVLGSFFFGRADSQGRMDLIARISGKLKDFVNSPAMDQAGLSNATTRFKP